MIVGKAKKAIDFADKEFLTLDENTLVAEAAKIMYERDACSVIITRNVARNNVRIRQPVGIVTSRDMLHRVVAQNKGPFKTALRDIMSAPLITIDQNTTIDDAVSLMARSDIARLPVIKDEGELFAVVSLKSLASGGSSIPKFQTAVGA